MGEIIKYPKRIYKYTQTHTHKTCFSESSVVISVNLMGKNIFDHWSLAFFFNAFIGFFNISLKFNFHQNVFPITWLLFFFSWR